MNNQVVVNEDRISELPEALILQILSFLPTKSALTTSVLSKQWQFLWKMMPELKFDYCDHKDDVGIFFKNVRSSLLSNTAPVLESLHLKFHPDNRSGVDFGMLIKTAKARHVRKLVLDAGYTNCYKIPQSLYDNETLETLILKARVAIEKPNKVCLKSLKTLHLHAVNITDRAWVFKFLSGCPNLEDLLVCLYPQSSVKTLTIAHPTLQRLSVYNKRGRLYKWGCFIDAPDLKYFCIEGDHGLCRFRMSNNVTKLMEANISDVYICYIIIDNILIPTATIFHQLVHLELFSYRGLRWDLLIFMLDSSPKLQVLELIHLRTS
ncbi:putative FBD-associated F-box protein [Raphanus sativus]|nr:putative FBD-associated F-box protein [Raphanus sativus]